MADPGFVVIGKKGKGKPKDDDEGKTEEKRLRDEGKIMILRFERVTREDEQYNYSDAADTIIKSIVNNHEDVTLCAKDGSESVENVDEIKSNERWSKYYEMMSVKLAKVTRLAFTIKIRADITKYHDMKQNEETFKLLKQEKWKLQKHKLTETEVDTRLAFNVLKINPFLVNKDNYGSMITSAIKQYAKDKESDRTVQSKLGVDFTKWVKYTNETLVEIGTRTLYADYDSKITGDVQIVNSIVLTISVEARWLSAIKYIIKAIKWDINKYGMIVEENPAKTNNLIMTMCEHNQLWENSAYVKLQWMPAELMKAATNFGTNEKPNNVTVEEKFLQAETVDENGKKSKIFRSVNAINEQLGMYFLITTKEDLDTATAHATSIVNSLNESVNLREDKWNRTIKNPERYSIMVVQKASSKAGYKSSTASTMENAKIEEDCERNKENGSFAPHPRHVTITTPSKRSYAEAAQGIVESKNDYEELSESEETKITEKLLTEVELEDQNDALQRMLKRLDQLEKTTKNGNLEREKMQQDYDNKINQMIQEIEQMKQENETLRLRNAELTKEYKSKLSKDTERITASGKTSTDKSKETQNAGKLDDTNDDDEKENDGNVNENKEDNGNDDTAKSVTTTKGLTIRTSGPLTLQVKHLRG